MKRFLGMVLNIWLACLTTNAQTAILPDSMVSFFEGTWKGAGEFSNKRKITATAIFKLTLDSSWIQYDHADELPNKYKATSFWKIDGDGQFVAYTFDNFGGHRKFASDGWKNDKLVLTTSEIVANKGLVRQHFIFEKLSDRNFKMTFETSKDNINWKLIDYLVFTKS